MTLIISDLVETVKNATLNGLAEISAVPAYNPRIIDTTTPEEFNELGRQHFGFFHFAQILEDLASGIRSGDIPVPE